MALVVACGGDGQVQQWPFTDENGRSCVHSCTDDRCGTDCDGESTPAAGCADDPCFTVENGPLHGDGPNVLGVCDACCAPEGGSIAITWVWTDCTPIVCEDDADCAVGSRRCEGGWCVE